MQTEIIKIGNSRGVRIPKAILEQCGFLGIVEMQVRDNALIISKPENKVRENWGELIDASFAKYGIPETINTEVIPTEFDDNEWLWDN